MILVNCADLVPLLGLFADGELGPELRAAVAAHLEQCATCAANLATIEELGELARKLPVPAPPADLWGRIAPHVSAPPIAGHVPGRSRALLRVAAVAALALVAVYTGWLAYGPTPSPPHPGLVMVDLGPYLEKGIPVNLPGGEGFTFVAAPLEKANQQVAFPLFDKAKLAEGYTARHCMVGCCGDHSLVQTEYRRGPEGCVMFQYPPGLKVAFGNSSAETVKVGEKAIKLIQGKTCWAASWETKGTGVTILGPRDRSELLRLVAHVARSLEGNTP